MTFAGYFDIITKSVCETGYEAFLPSLCFVDGGQIEMKVLEGTLSEDGEEEVAMNWMESFAQDGRIIFLAYRCGQRRIAVLEIQDFEALRKREIRIDPHQAEEHSETDDTQ